MRVLTNTQSVQVGGITQATSSFIRFLEENNKRKIQLIGVDILRNYSSDKSLKFERVQNDRLTIITKEVFCKKIQEVLDTVSTLSEIKKEYKHIIQAYSEIIKEEKPDLIVINGTYYIPWCLYLAAKNLGIPMILHYHGILTKETEHLEVKQALLMKKMEQTFDNSLLYYIFPSELAREVVEREVFGHKIAQSAILPNPIADYYFDIKTKKKSRSIGIVGRWSPIKNPEFVTSFANYNRTKNSYFDINVVTDLSVHKRIEKKLSKIVKLFLPMETKKLAKFYSQMGVIICPSYFETYGNVPQEAIAAGTPALVSRNMGVAEVFKKVGLHNLIVDFSSPEEVFLKIKEIRKFRISDDVRAKMRRELSGDRVNSKLLKIYKMVVS